MLLAEEITAVPEEQALITALDPVLSPLYRDLPYHNYPHARDDVLTEVLRLDELDTDNSTPRERFKLIAACLGHDALDHLAVTSFETKEQRAAEAVRPILPDYGFSPAEVDDVDGMIISTGPKAECTTPSQIKLRRGDLSNVASQCRTPFIATTVKIFHEEVILCLEAGEEPPKWTSFLDRQHEVLEDLLAQDLSVGPEKTQAGVGPFNRVARRNNKLLASKNGVRSPRLFVSRYGARMREAVPAFQDIVPYIIAQAAA